MRRGLKGCGCAIGVLVVVLGAAGVVGWKFVWPRWKLRPPPPSGRELQVHVLDVGPIEGDSILIIAPGGKTVLIDAGDTGKGKVIADALKRYNVQQLDYFVATHPHSDHIGGADEVFKVTKVLNVIDNGLPPDLPESLRPKEKPATKSGKKSEQKPAAAARAAKSVTTFYDEYQQAIAQSGAHYEKAQPGAKFDLGDGVRLTVLAPLEPSFTRDKMKTGGNVTNANSVVIRLDYGDFSLLLPGDAEEQTEHQMLTKDLNLSVRILKVAHHGSKYATSQDMLDRVKPQVAIVSCGEWNRYGHPSQVVLDRLKAANVKLYRTDLQGEITITTRGKENDFTIKTAKEAKSELWEGRLAQKDDSSRSGFIAYGDFGPPPKKSGK